MADLTQDERRDAYNRGFSDGKNNDWRRPENASGPYWDSKKIAQAKAEYVRGYDKGQDERKKKR